MTCDFIALTAGHVRHIKPYIPGKPIEEVTRKYGVQDVIKLASNENPLGPAPKVREALQQALAGRNLAYYPDAAGYDLKQALCAKLKITTDKITLGNGSNELLDLIARVFVDDRHSIVYSQYAFPIYPLVTQAIGAHALEVPARDWGHDLVAMQAAVREDTRLVFVANPNNPTGTWNDKEALKRFLDGVPEQVIVIVDEAYFEYVEAPADSLQWLADYPNMIVLRTFSKAYGLAGLRVGYAVSHPQIAELLNRVRAPFNVNSMGLLGAEIALGEEAHLQAGVELNRNGLQQLQAGFTELGLDYIPSRGNFVCVDSGYPAQGVYEALLKHGVIVRPTGVDGMPTHLRVSVGTEAENARCLETFAKVLTEYR